VTVDKARAAIDAARALDLDGADADRDGLPPLQLAEQFTRLLTIARTQAEIAQAEATERCAEALEGIWSTLNRRGAA
jgi:gamma-glutamylcysteine synthetase